MNKIIRFSLQSLLLLVLSLFLFACTAKTHAVSFVNDNGSILLLQLVVEGEDATPPVDPVKIGYTFSGWDLDYNTITSDRVITAT